MSIAAALAATLASPVELAQDAKASTDALRVVRDKQIGKLGAPKKSEELKQMLDVEKAGRKAGGRSEPSADPRPVQVRTYGSGMRVAVLGPDGSRHPGRFRSVHYVIGTSEVL